MIGSPLSETATGCPLAVLTTWPAMKPPLDEREGWQIDLLACQALAVGQGDTDAVLRLGQEMVATFRHHQAKPSGLVRGGERLTPFVDPPGRDDGSLGGSTRGPVGHGPRHCTTGGQRDDDLRRQ